MDTWPNSPKNHLFGKKSVSYLHLLRNFKRRIWRGCFAWLPFERRWCFLVTWFSSKWQGNFTMPFFFEWISQCLFFPRNRGNPASWRLDFRQKRMNIVNWKVWVLVKDYFDNKNLKKAGYKCFFFPLSTYSPHNCNFSQTTIKHG